MEISPLVILEDAKLRVESMASIERKATKTAAATSILYIGTNDGTVIKYIMLPSENVHDLQSTRISDDGLNRARSRTMVVQKTSIIDAHFNHRKYLNVGRKPITKMVVDKGTTHSLVCLCDGVLVLVDPDTLDVLATTKDTKVPPITTFCFVEATGRVAAASKRRVMVCECTARDGILPVPDMEFTLADNVLDLVTLSGLLVVGMRKEYASLHLATGQLVDQAVAEKSSGPLLHAVPDHGGVLVRLAQTTTLLKADDTTPWDEKRKIEWVEEAAALAHCDTYVVAASSKTVNVYSMLDNDFCEPIPNQCATPYRVVAEFTNCICVATGRDVHVLSPIPFERLLTRRIAELRIKDAIGLFNRNFMGTEEERTISLTKIYESAGFACFERLHFPQAFQYFRDSAMCPRDVLTLFPEYQARSCTSMVASKRPGMSLHTAIESATDETPEIKLIKATRCREKLTEYLWGFRDQKTTVVDDVQVAIDYALLMLFLEEHDGLDEETLTQRSDKLFLPKNSLSVDEVVPILERQKKDRLLCLLYVTKGNIAEALSRSKATGALHEAVVALQQTSDVRLIMEYLPWMMGANPDESIKALLVPRSPPLSIDLVLSLVGSYPEDILQLYLEHAVNVEGSADPVVHTHLARIYIRSIVVLGSFNVPRHTLLKCRAGEEAGYYGELRRKLLAFLTESECYVVSTVLGELNLTGLHEERVIVYSKCGQYDSALRVLVDELKDLVEAEAYCVRRFAQQRASDKKQSEDQTSAERGVYHGVYKHNEYLATLIRILLHGDTPRIDIAVDLLTRHARNLSALKILSIVPRTMPVAMLSPYLRTVFGQVTHLRNRERIAAETMSGDCVKHATFLAKLQARSVRVDDKRTCPVCGKKIADSMLAVFPNLTVCHFRCFKDKQIDPVRSVPFQCDLSRIN